MTTTTLDHIRRLDPRIQVRAWYLVHLVNRALAAHDVPERLKITSSRRSLEEQRRLVVLGRSRTLKSAHVAGLAFDVDLEGWAREDVPDSFWWVVGPFAERLLGLTWGGRWNSPYDPGHFEYRV